MKARIIISFFQSRTKNNFKNSKNNDKNKNTNTNITPIMKAKNNRLYTLKNTNRKYEENTLENFSYSYSNMLVDYLQKKEKIEQ